MLVALAVITTPCPFASGKLKLFGSTLARGPVMVNVTPIEPEGATPPGDTIIDPVDEPSAKDDGVAPITRAT